MSIWSFLGLDPKKLAGDTASSNTSKAETETVRKIVAELEADDPEHARYIAAFAYLLTRVAHADHYISPDESAVIERIVQGAGQEARQGAGRENGGLTEAQAVLVAQIARTQNLLFAGTENYLVAREFTRLASREQKLHLIDCMYAVCGADRNISVVEDNEISRIANELRLDHADIVAVRLRHREHLAVLKK